MIHYLLQILAFQLLFLLIYDAFLKKETFFQWNRAYLLLTSLLSLVLPFISIEAIQQQIPPNYHIALPAVLLGGQAQPQNIMLDAITLTASEETYFQGIPSLLLLLWVCGMVAMTALFLFKLIRLIRLKRSGILREAMGIRYYELPGTDTAFSFFHWIFLGEALGKTQTEHILMHEQIHVRQHHSWDLLYFELLRIPLWFNPLLYLYQRRIITLQEFIADAGVVCIQDKKSYYQELLSQVFQTTGVSFTSTFFNHSLIKKRIIMLQQSKSKRIFQLKYLVLLPAVFSMLVYTSCSQEQADTVSENSISEKIADLKMAIAEKETLTQAEAAQLQALLEETGVSKAASGSGMNKEEIPFTAIESVPVFPGCEGVDAAEARQCFTQKLMQYIGANFNTSVAKGTGLTGKQRIAAHFTIDDTGQPVHITAEAGNELLVSEAKRVLAGLPKMIPGKQDGKEVAVKFSIPIIFEVGE